VHKRRQLAQIIGRHFTLLRKSQRTTLTALALGLSLSLSGKLGLASIARPAGTGSDRLAVGRCFFLFCLRECGARWVQCYNDSV